MFNLTRYFSITSLIGLAAVVTVLLFLIRMVAVEHLVEHEEHNNETVANGLVNAIWHNHRDFAINSHALSNEQLVVSNFVKRIDSDIRKLVQGTSILKVKIYNASGNTIYSTDASQIGQNKSEHPGFLSAISGTPSSDISFRDEFDAHHGALENIDVIYSYVPVNSPAGSPEAVLEVYSDVTHLVHQITGLQWLISGVLIGSMLLLYLFQLLLVRHAQRLLTAQEDAQRMAANQLRHQAFHDDLTGLPNRARFLSELDERSIEASDSGERFALMLLDLDRFKMVNDGLGHEVGDQLLAAVAHRLRNCVPECASVYRIGGDEFTILVSEIRCDDQAQDIARAIHTALEEPINLGGRQISVCISIGIAIFPEDANTADRLVRSADAAMYHAKTYSKGGFAMFDKTIKENIENRLNLESDLQRAIREEHFVLHYQPRLDAKTGNVVCSEALLRWDHPERGLIPPLEFIPLLEETGMIVPVGDWIIRNVCEQTRSWIQSGLTPVRTSINISARQIGAGLEESVRAALAEFDIDPHLLELELTETTLLEDLSAAQRTIASLKSLGVSVSIDDFGTGYSSLGLLKDLNIDYLKIDRRFIKDIETLDRDAQIVSAIIELSRILDIKVVAEGVETEHQAAFLRKRNCDELQGFLYSKPVTPDILQTEFLQPRPAIRAVS